ncbi:MAG: DUF4149 domain-containing protein [Gammaproteobacteria bacterium]|nr:DUF4149 domain-containing protein [Gammaproteobacteria bacterium]
MKKIEGLENLTLALWVGCMIGVGYIAAPVLFSTLDDRQVAGMLAGKMFHAVTIMGLICGGILLVLRYRDESVQLFKQWRGWLLLLMLGCVASSMFVLQPMIVEVKALGLIEGSDAAKKFGMLHGISSLVYMASVISGCILLFVGRRASLKQ